MGNRVSFRLNRQPTISGKVKSVKRTNNSLEVTLKVDFDRIRCFSFYDERPWSGYKYYKTGNIICSNRRVIWPCRRRVAPPFSSGVLDMWLNEDIEKAQRYEFLDRWFEDYFITSTSTKIIIAFGTELDRKGYEHMSKIIKDIELSIILEATYKEIISKKAASKLNEKVDYEQEIIKLAILLKKEKELIQGWDKPGTLWLSKIDAFLKITRNADVFKEVLPDLYKIYGSHLPVELLDLHFKPGEGRGWEDQLQELRTAEENYLAASSKQ